MATATAALGRWGLFGLWALLPIVAGPTFASALEPTETSFRTSVSIALWLIWAVVLTASLVPRTVTLTAVRVAVPAAPCALAWAAVAAPETSASTWAGMAVALSATIVCLSAATGSVFANGSAYGAERRFLLRPPGMLLLGPIELAWLAAVAGAGAGPLLLAAGSIGAGVVALIVGWPVAALCVRALHALAGRFAVFTQAGLVIVDPTYLADALLALRRSITAIGPAPRPTEATDLTAQALGLALQLRFATPQTITLRPTRSARAALAEQEVDAILFSVSRPGDLLREARERRMPIG